MAEPAPAFITLGFSLLFSAKWIEPWCVIGDGDIPSPGLNDGMFDPQSSFLPGEETSPGEDGIDRSMCVHRLSVPTIYPLPVLGTLPFHARRVAASLHAAGAPQGVYLGTLGPPCTHPGVCPYKVMLPLPAPVPGQAPPAWNSTQGCRGRVCRCVCAKRAGCWQHRAHMGGATPQAQGVASPSAWLLVLGAGAGAGERAGSEQRQEQGQELGQGKGPDRGKAKAGVGAGARGRGWIGAGRNRSRGCSRGRLGQEQRLGRGKGRGWGSVKV